MGCDVCRELLAEGLDLCVRARQLDAQDRANTHIQRSVSGAEWEASGQFAKFAEEVSEMVPHAPVASKSATVHLWVQDQYEKDLYAWEENARQHLMQGCAQ